MVANPIVLIPCLFVGAADYSFAKVIALGWLCSSIGALFSYPLMHFFVAYSARPSNDNELLRTLLAGIIAGTFITGAMFMFSHRRKSGVSGEPQQSDHDVA